MLQRLGPNLYRTHIFLSLGVKHAITAVDLFNVKKTEFMQILFGTNLIEPISITYLNIKGGDKKKFGGNYQTPPSPSRNLWSGLVERT